MNAVRETVEETAQSQNLKSRFDNVIKIIGAVTRVSGLLLTVVSMHILVIRPLVQRVDHLQAELHGIEVTLSKVAAEQSHLHSTNDLLSELKTQHDAIAGARATLQQMQKLREEIEIESSKIPDAMEAVTRLSELPDHLHQSELKRYTTLVKPVPDPYQISPVTDLRTDSEEKSTTSAPIDKDKQGKPRVSAPPLLYISGNDRKNSERISAKESSQINR